MKKLFSLAAKAIKSAKRALADKAALASKLSRLAPVLAALAVACVITSITDSVLYYYIALSDTADYFPVFGSIVGVIENIIAMLTPGTTSDWAIRDAAFLIATTVLPPAIAAVFRKENRFEKSLALFSALGVFAYTWGYEWEGVISGEFLTSGLSFVAILAIVGAISSNLTAKKLSAAAEISAKDEQIQQKDAEIFLLEDAAEREAQANLEFYAQAPQTEPAPFQAQF